MGAFRFIPPTPAQIREYFEKQKPIIFESVKEAYLRACMDAVNHARTTDTYKDRTGNLRSSIGYVLYFNGQLVHENFQMSGVRMGGSNTEAKGSKGTKSGRDLAHEVALKHPTGFVAVIVAGMNYALFVEAKGFDVLTGATLNLPKHLKGYFMDIDRQHGTNFAKR